MWKNVEMPKRNIILIKQRGKSAINTFSYSSINRINHKSEVGKHDEKRCSQSLQTLIVKFYIACIITNKIWPSYVQRSNIIQSSGQKKKTWYVKRTINQIKRCKWNIAFCLFSLIIIVCVSAWFCLSSWFEIVSMSNEH